MASFSTPDPGGRSPIRVLLVDDHAVVRQGLRTFLELQPDIEIAGEAADGQAAVEAARELEPDVILMDLVMPVLDGLAAIARIRAAGSRARILALTSFSDEDKVVPAIQAGATGYLLKDVSPAELVAAIRAVQEGRSYLDPKVAHRLVRRVAEPPAPDPAADLTPRELEVLRLIARGQSNQEIAGTLFISEKTVKSHVSNILSKLGVSGRTQAALYALCEGLAPLRED